VREERAARKNAEARVSSCSWTKKETGSVSRDGDLGPPTRRRTGGLQKGEMASSAAGNCRSDVGDEILKEASGEATRSTKGGPDSNRNGDECLLEDRRVDMDHSLSVWSTLASSPAGVKVDELA
jgi:hypothetical protein